MKPDVQSLRFDFMNIQQQTNAYDCGIYAIACATELALGFDPVLCSWDCEHMREHLLNCLERGKMD